MVIVIREIPYSRTCYEIHQEIMSFDDGNPKQSVQVSKIVFNDKTEAAEYAIASCKNLYFQTPTVRTNTETYNPAYKAWVRTQK